MKFGLAIPNYKQDVATTAIRQFAKRAEELGYDSLWASDHIVVPEDVADRYGPTFSDPFVVAAYVAAATERIRIGISAVVVPLRTALHQAKLMSTLDVVSGGRMTFAMAAGWSKDEMDVVGVPFNRRGALTNEYLELFRTVWSDPTPVFDGKTQHIRGIVFDPRPLQDPLPLWGAGNSQAAISRAARFCQGWHPQRQTPEVIVQGIEFLKSEAARFGRSDQVFEIGMRMPMAGHEKMIETAETYGKAGVTHLVINPTAAPSANEQDPDSILAAIERFATEAPSRIKTPA
jgi:probable F420-dependent oxidoreductase